MKNIIDNIVVLENGSKYYVVNQANYLNKGYYFVIKVNEEETDFENEGYFVEEVSSDPLTLVRVEDPNLLKVLIKYLAFEKKERV